ncbi:MAG TPA: hypothetical protein DEV85_10865 [Vibrio sp.]|nr:hypothetical protein [Vibrio sp.]
MQNSELSSKPLGKEDWRRNVGTFQTNLTLYKGLNEAPKGQVKKALCGVKWNRNRVTMIMFNLPCLKLVLFLLKLAS